MTPERWRQVKEVLQEALDRPLQERRTHLDSSCNGDQELRDEVESLLLEENDGTAAFLRSPIDSAVQDLQQESPWVGRRIGSYEIIKIIGEGGMGSVYRASRADDQYQKQVAIKIVRLGLNSPSAVARFRAERQILANLEHPNIARLLDGGTTEHGIPYVVMELVEGHPIDEYCDAHGLSINERLRLFRAVCLAVQYAHQHLVVHRDLKPGNILVTADGTPKLLDFGIAKILDAGSLPCGAEPTVGFMRMLTPEYASPEQVREETVTTASDVYSLGVILFLLLTGRRPYEFDTRSADAMIRAICDTEPPKPSAAALRTNPSAAANLQVSSRKEVPMTQDPGKLSRQLRGDLDNIVLMALRKDPQRRYASAEQFAEDIRRHLADLPVAARNDTLDYRVSKFVERHKVGSATTAAVALLLLAALLVTIHEARIARRQAEIARQQSVRAEQRFNDVRSLANSLLFDVHDAIQDLPGSTPARKMIVEKSLRYLDSLSAESGDDPGLLRELATAYQRVGEIQGHYLAYNLGETSNTLASYQKALNIRKRLGERKDADWTDRLNLAEMYRRMASQLIAVGNSRDSLEDIQSAIAITEALSTVQPDNVKVLFELAYDYRIRGHIQANGFLASQNDLAASLDSYRKARVTDEHMLAQDPGSIEAQRSIAGDMMFIANNETDLELRADALATYNRALQAYLALSPRSKASRDLRSIAVVYNHLAIFHENAGDWKAALENYEKGFRIYKKLAEQDPKNILLQQGLAIAYANIGNVEGRLREFTDAFAKIRQGLAVMKPILADDPTMDERGVAGQMYIDLGDTFVLANRFSDAGREYEAAMHIFEGVHPDQNVLTDLGNVGQCKVGIADVQLHLGDLKSASTNFEEALTALKAHLKPTDLDGLQNVADAYVGLGDIESTRAQRAPADEKRLHWEKATEWYRQGLDARNQLPTYARIDGPHFHGAEVSIHADQAQAELAKLPAPRR